MGLEISGRLVAKQFAGRVSAADPHDLPPGAMQTQDNLQCITPGMATVRKGLRPQTTRGTVEGIALYYYPSPAQDRLVMETSDGHLKTARAPSFGALTTITGTARNTFGPVSFAKARSGDLIVVDGLTRGLRWDGVTAAVEALGIDAPTAAATVGVSGGGAATAGSYVAGYRYIDNTLPVPVPSSLSDLTTVTATANQRFDWSVILQSASTATRPVQIQLFRSAAGAPGTVYLVTTLTNTPGGANATYTDTASDATLIASTALPILLPNGDLNARRFTPPPTHTPVVIMHGDRAWYAGGVHYNLGTVATGGNTTLTGTGTAWTTAMIGRYAYVSGEVVPFTVTAVASGTSLTLSASAATTASGLFYSISPPPEYRNATFFSEVDEPESVPVVNVVELQNNTGDSDEIVGLMSFGANLYFLQQRHIYIVPYFRQPSLDANPSLLARRGVCNQRCWTLHGELAYLMDASGCYRFNGQSIDPISDPIGDLWADATIDMSVSKWFFVESDPIQDVVRFHVSYTADSSTRPKRWLEYNVSDGQWTTGSCLDELGGGVIAPISGRLRTLWAAEDDIVHLVGEGTADVVSTALRGTVTSSTSTTLTDSTAGFTDAVLGAPVAIISGTGKGQERKITARTGTQLTVATWTTNPDTTSVYLVGAISWSCKTGLFDLEDKSDRSEYKKRSLRVTFNPTTNAATLDVRRYLNHSTTAESVRIAQNLGAGVTCDLVSPTDLVVDLKSAKVVGTVQDGFAEVIGQGGITPDRSQALRFLSFDLRGYQGLDQISLYEIAFDSMSQ